MSRIGNKPIEIPKEVSLTATGNAVVIKGPKGELAQTLSNKNITVKQEGNQIVVSRKNENRQTKAFHGLIRSLIANMVRGVTEGYEKRLELVGTGYRVKKEGNNLTITVGFSHPITIESIDGINLEIEGNNQIIISGIDKQKVGQVAAMIRSKKKPEPYKGKGIRYQGEIVRRKAGKAAATTE